MKLKTEIAVIVVVVMIVAAGLFFYINYGSGVLDVKITDPPLEWGQVTQIYLNISAVEIHRAQSGNESGWTTLIDQSSWINLTKTLDVNQTIGVKNLQAGKYNLIRFEILEAIVTVAGANHTALVPSGEITLAIAKGGVPSGVQINTGQTSTVLIELDITVQESGAFGFRLVPGIRAEPV